MKWPSCFHFIHKLFLLLILVVFCLVPLLSPVSLAASPASNNLWIWGANYTDQLGDGSSTAISQFMAVERYIAAK
jgi:hypothetical protein